MLPLDFKSAPNARIRVHAYGELFLCASAFAMLKFPELVKPVAKVMVTGDGGDDVFLGYDNHLQYWYLQRISKYVLQGLANAWIALREQRRQNAGR